MHVVITAGNSTDKNISICYDYLIRRYREDYGDDWYLCEGGQFETKEEKEEKDK